MSQIIWKKELVPDQNAAETTYTHELYPDLTAERTLAIPVETNSLVQLPDPRAYRSMSRAAVMLSAVALPSKDEVLAPILEKDPFKVGIYCGVEQGPTDYKACQQMLSTTAAEFAETYRKLRTPKQYLRQLPNLAAAQLGIFLNAMGPLNVYIHSKHAVLHAFEQAEFDLNQGIVERAVVCAAFSFEDPLLVFRTRDDIKENVLCEGAFCVVLEKSDSPTQWNQKLTSSDAVTHSFGIATPLKQLF